MAGMINSILSSLKYLIVAIICLLTMILFSETLYLEKWQIIKQFFAWCSQNRYWLIAVVSLSALFLSWIFFLHYERRKRKCVQAIYDAMPLRVVVADGNGNIYFHQTERNLVGAKKINPKKISDIPQALQTLFYEVKDHILSGADQAAEYDYFGVRRRAYFSKLPASIFGVETVLWVSIDISELAMSRDLLAETAESLRITLESIGDGVIVTDNKEQVTVCNQVAANLTGYDKHEVLGKPLADIFNIVSYQNGQRVPSPVAQALREDKIVELSNHTDLIAPNGTRRHISDSAAPIHKKNGEIFGAVLVFRDVTREYEQRDKLRSNHSLLQNAAEMANIDYFHYDSQSNVLVPCRRYWPEPKVSISSARQWIVNEDLTLFETEWQKLLDGSSFELQLNYRTVENGRLRYYTMRAQNIETDDISGVSGGIVGIIQDVTEYKTMANSYEDANRLLNTLMENFPNPVLVKDISDNFKYVVANRSFAAFCGLTPADVVGKTDFELFENRVDAEGFRRADELVLQSDGILHFDDTFVDCDGLNREFSTNKTVITRSDGKKMLVAIGTDVSGLKNAQHERDEMIGKLTNYVKYERIFNRCLQNITLQNNLQDAIDNLLMQIGGTIDADRCYVFKYDKSNNTISNIYEWVAAGIECQIMHLQNIDFDNFALIKRKMCNNEFFSIDDLSLIHDEELQFTIDFLLAQGIKSIMMNAIWHKDELWGFIGIDFIKHQHTFTESDVHLIRNAAHLFWLAMEREWRNNELADSVALQKQVFDNISVPILLVDLDFNVVKCNAALNKLAKVDAENVRWKKCFDKYCFRADGPPDYCPVRTVIETGKACTQERVVYGRQALISAQPIFDRNGKMIYVLESGFDITKLRQQQEELRLNNVQMNSYLQQDILVNKCLEMLVLNPDAQNVMHEIIQILGRHLKADSCGVLKYDKNTKVLRNEKKWCSTEDSIEVNSSDIINEASFPLSFAKLRTREILLIDLSDSKTVSPEKNELSEYLKQRDMQILCSVSIYFKGEFWGSVGMEFSGKNGSFDRTTLRLLSAAARIIEVLLEREFVYKELVRSENEKNMIWELMTIPLVLFNNKRQIIRVNPAAEKMAGLTSEQILSQECFESFCKNEIPDDQCPVSLTLQAGKPQQIECKLCSRDYEVQTLPVIEDGDISGVLLMYIDKTQDNENKKRLLKAIESAQAGEQAKSNFLATMSHEIRTPLNAVIGFSELLKIGDSTEAEQKEYLQSINFAGKALLQLINDILDLSKLDSGRMEMALERDDLKKLCEELLTIFSLRAKDKGIELILNCSDPLPLLYFNVQRLRQVLLNLVGNAVKFTVQGKITLNVNFVPEDQQYGVLTIKVMDTGIGISNDFKKRIFEPFVQQTRVRGSNEGTGLGLAISRRLIEHMGGMLNLDSDWGQGSCFTITLPKVEYFSNKDSGEDAGDASDKNSNVYFQRNILLVDDVMMNLKVLKAMLKKSNARVEMASSGHEALKILEDFTPDIILTDMWMPKMNGSQLSYAIRENKKFAHTIIIAVTADTETLGNFSMEMFNDILLKPVSISKLKKLFNDIDLHLIDRTIGEKNES